MIKICSATVVQNIIFKKRLVDAVPGNLPMNARIFVYFIMNNFKFVFYKSFFTKIFIFLNLFLLLGIFNIQAQHSTNYTLYSNIIYRLTKYVDWPGDKKSGDFIIGIVGDSPLYDELKGFTANKWVGNQKITVTKFTSAATFFSCHILYINDDKSSSIKKIVAATKGASILIVSESDGLARKGSCINFIIVDERLKLEINKANIEDRHLDIASELLSLGTIIKDPS